MPILCPNLTEISLSMDNDSIGHAPGLFLILSSSLKTMALRDVTKESAPSVCVVLSMLRCHRTPIRKMSHFGWVDPEIFLLICQFTSLKSVVIRPEGLDYRLDESTLALLKNLADLTEVDIDIDLVGTSAERTLGGCLETLQLLSTLTLYGYQSEIKDCLFANSFVFNAIQKLSLIFKPDLPLKSLFSLIISRFPMLHSLHIEIAAIEEDGRDRYLLKDILELKTRDMKCIILHGMWVDLSAEDIITILSTWPQLEEFSLSLPVYMGDGEVYAVYDAQLLLPYLSTHHSHLHTLGLPLDLSSLRALPPFPTPSQPRSPLRQLSLFQRKGLPSSLKEKLNVVENIIALFPCLATIQGRDPPLQRIEDLQAILTSFRNVISSPTTTTK